ncbi:hypothetical protein Nmel_018138 [Mimus melanotis]
MGTLVGTAGVCWWLVLRG